MDSNTAKTARLYPELDPEDAMLVESLRVRTLPAYRDGRLVSGIGPAEDKTTQDPLFFIVSLIEYLFSRR